MAICSSSKLVTKCNNSHVYADFRRSAQRNQSCTGKKIFDFLVFLVLLRLFLDFPAAQANTALNRARIFDNDLGSGDGLERKSRQILKPRKSFFAAIRASESKKEKMVNGRANEVQNSESENSTKSGKNIFTTTQNPISIEVNFTEIPVDLTSIFDNKNFVEPITNFAKSAGQNYSQELDRGKRNNPLPVNQDSQPRQSSQSETSEDFLDVNFNDMKASAKGKEIVLYVCLALTAIFALERGTQIMLCVCQRLNNRPSRRQRRNFQHMEAQENEQMNILRERIASLDL